jgi:hypothetical protein
MCLAGDSDDPPRVALPENPHLTPDLTLVVLREEGCQGVGDLKVRGVSTGRPASSHSAALHVLLDLSEKYWTNQDVLDFLAGPRIIAARVSVLSVVH